MVRGGGGGGLSMEAGWSAHHAQDPSQFSPGGGELHLGLSAPSEPELSNCDGWVGLEPSQGNPSEERQSCFPLIPVGPRRLAAVVSSGSLFPCLSSSPVSVVQLLWECCCCADKSGVSPRMSLIKKGFTTLGGFFVCCFLYKL